ncbi:MAG: N-formylglutamate amidohydrolase [Paracoccaceae bacterium]
MAADLHSVLLADEGPAARVVNPNGASPVVIVCEHASSRIPRALGNLGLDDAALMSHIAWDPGALGVSLALGKALDAAVVTAAFSRLAYDCNRPPDAPAAMPARSEVYDIPGNLGLDDAQKQARVQGLYAPFHAAVGDALAARGAGAVLVTIHSFTPVYFGQKRAVELGILHDSDARLADAMLAQASAFTAMKTERNQPYGPDDGVTHTLQRHGVSLGILNVMIEIRNDLLTGAKAQAKAAQDLAGLLKAALASPRKAVA